MSHNWNSQLTWKTTEAFPIFFKQVRGKDDAGDLRDAEQTIDLILNGNKEATGVVLPRQSGGHLAQSTTVPPIPLLTVKPSFPTAIRVTDASKEPLPQTGGQAC